MKGGDDDHRYHAGEVRIDEVDRRSHLGMVDNGQSSVASASGGVLLDHLLVYLAYLDRCKYEWTSYCKVGWWQMTEIK